jgi:ABC-type antimicrobial peptide transport system permease subunit
MVAVAAFALPLAALSLVLAIIAIYASVAYATALRTPEMGVRVALGASPTRVRWFVVRQALVPTALGVGLGMLLSAAASRILRAMFEGFPTSVLPAVVATATCLTAVALLASYAPARRASSVDPAKALKQG